jgi:hypothetical protein
MLASKRGKGSAAKKILKTPCSVDDLIAENSGITFTLATELSCLSTPLLVIGSTTNPRSSQVLVPAAWLDIFRCYLSFLNRLVRLWLA